MQAEKEHPKGSDAAPTATDTPMDEPPKAEVPEIPAKGKKPKAKAKGEPKSKSKAKAKGKPKDNKEPEAPAAGRVVEPAPKRQKVVEANILSFVSKPLQK